MTQIQRYIDTSIEKATKVVTDFTSKVAENPTTAAYHLEWSQDVIDASQTLRLLAPMKKAIGEGKDPVEMAKRFIENAERHLLGPAGMGAGRGPWTPCSTSPMANTMAIAESNAYREIRADLLALIELDCW